MQLEFGGQHALLLTVPKPVAGGAAAPAAAPAVPAAGALTMAGCRGQVPRGSAGQHVHAKSESPAPDATQSVCVPGMSWQPQTIWQPQ